MMEVEATICPICDEACTCPKTSLLVSVKGNNTNSSPSKSGKPTKKTTNATKKSTSSTSNSSARKRKTPVAELSSSDDDEEEVYTFPSSDEETAADKALSFIKMIYSDEESLDEEEAYALYQATQLFSSSSEDEEYLHYQERQKRFLNEYSSSEMDDEEEEDSEEEEDEDDESESDYAYTVVEYVNPIRPGLTRRLESNSSLATPPPSSVAPSMNSEKTANDNETPADWTTWSVFDINGDDSEVITIQATSAHSSNTPSLLSSTGAGTPETLLFSTSATDKIPNIAPQVLAAISAAAKSMAAGGTGQAATKYFSYITTVKTASVDQGVEGEDGEFLFFEEDDDSFDEEECDSLGSVSDSDGEAVVFDEDDRCSVTSAESFEGSELATINSNLQRWNRVPIGAFRRSRRLSLPRVIHPLQALKSSVDPSVTMALPGPLLTATESGEESLHPGDQLQRAYSVITLDELNIDISNSNNSNSTNKGDANCSHPGLNGCFQCSSPVWPAPKRSKSVIPTTNATSEWNWTWDM